MYARVMSVKSAADEDTQQAGALLRERALPAMRQLRGFRGAYFLRDSQTGEGLTILLWDDQQAAEAGEEAMRPTREELMKQRGVTLQSARGYEVIASA